MTFRDTKRAARRSGTPETAALGPPRKSYRASCQECRWKQLHRDAAQTAYRAGRHFHRAGHYPRISSRAGGAWIELWPAA